jgi:hypothetical protein
MKYIDTDRQLADILTNPLDASHFANLQGGTWCLPSLWLGLRGNYTLSIFQRIAFLHIHLSYLLLHWLY